MADFFAAASALHTLRRSLAKAMGLTGSEIAILLAIRRLVSSGDVTIAAIANHLRFTNANTQIEVAKLVEAGFVIRQSIGPHSHKTTVHLTSEGQRRLDRLVPAVRKLNDILFHELTIEEMHQARSFLNRFILQAAGAATKIGK